jgi:hypothetical protein
MSDSPAVSLGECSVAVVLDEDASCVRMVRSAAESPAAASGVAARDRAEGAERSLPSWDRALRRLGK